MSLPLPRYRVIERDRRLVVIDTWKGETPAQAPLAAPSASRRDSRSALGGRTITTHPFYDARGPRAITLGAAAERLVSQMRIVAIACIVFFGVMSFYWPIVAVVLVAIVAQPKVRRGLREPITAWLDTAGQETGDTVSSAG